MVEKLRKVAELVSPQSGLAMHLHTTQVGLQFYTGEFLTQPFQQRAGLCLEAQGFPMRLINRPSRLRD